MSERSTIAAERLAWLDEEHQAKVLRRRRIGLAIGSIVLVGAMVLAVLDGVDAVDTFGVDDATVAAEAEGTTLEVRYPTLSRPALASPFDIQVTRDGGFGGQQVEVAIAIEYLNLWDLNGLFPAPAEETADGDRVIWTFDPPDGDTLRIVYEARIEPAAQNGAPGRVAVLDHDGTELVAVDFDTRLRP